MEASDALWWRALTEAAVADMAKAPVPSKVAWSEPSLEELLTIRGGYSQKACPVKSYKEIVSGYGEVTFVHISKKTIGFSRVSVANPAIEPL